MQSISKYTPYNWRLSRQRADHPDLQNTIYTLAHAWRGKSCFVYFKIVHTTCCYICCIFLVRWELPVSAANETQRNRHKRAHKVNF